MPLPRILITAGEPAGIGPELVVKLAQSQHPAQLIVAANKALLQKTAQQLELPLTLLDYSSNKPITSQQPSNLYLIDHPMNNEVTAGHLDSHNSPYVLNTLHTAANMALNNEVDALLTGPVHKAILNQSTKAEYFSGHTEFFAEKAQVDQVVMMLATEGLRVALVTTHLPLKEVPSAINQQSLSKVIKVLNDELRNKFAITSPRILVLGLNPHAGESGLLGTEEIEIIEPVIQKLNSELSAEILGPLPADTAFSEKYLLNADAVLAMYHDQGLPVLKYKGFGNAANITLGLPFIRTSVDHGTGLDIAGKNCASLGSIEYALQMAIELAQARMNKELS